MRGKFCARTRAPKSSQNRPLRDSVEAIHILHHIFVDDAADGVQDVAVGAVDGPRSRVPVVGGGARTGARVMQSILRFYNSAVALFDGICAAIQARGGGGLDGRGGSVHGVGMTQAL